MEEPTSVLWLNCNLNKVDIAVNHGACGWNRGIFGLLRGWLQ